MRYKELLPEIWQKVYDEKSDTEREIRRYFHRDFLQCIDGQKKNLDAFISHIVKQKSLVRGSYQFRYHFMVEEDNLLACAYWVKGVGINDECIVSLRQVCVN